MTLSKSLEEIMLRCSLCVRNCAVNRMAGELGFCCCDSNPLVASICIHHGEEPVISGKKGICNVFFSHCNLECVYCQNFQISRNNTSNAFWLTSYDAIVDRIVDILNQGINRLGFVSPTHQLLQMVEIINRLNAKGYKPVIVYNTNSYDNPKVLRLLNGIVDVYLPDFKYSSDELAKRLSKAEGYQKAALACIKEMVWQRGSSLILDEDEHVISGVIVRHLILPGYTHDSIKALEALANEVSTNLYISLMAQYHPTCNTELKKKLSRCITKHEYKTVSDALRSFGFYRGWMQELESSANYLPNFFYDSPFE